MKRSVFTFFVACFVGSAAFAGSSFFGGGGGGGPAGSFLSPNFTGTPTFYTDRFAVTDGGDRTRFLGNTVEFFNAANDRSGIFIHIDGTHPQLTTLGMDKWFEPGTGGATEGSIAFYNRAGRIGWSAYQQGELPGWRHPKDLGLSNGLHFVATSEAATETLTSDHARILYSGTRAGANQTLSVLGTDAFKINNTGGTRYIEQYLGASSIFKTQQNVDAWINDAKFVSYSSTAAKSRVGDLTLSSGAVTVSNTNNDANDKLFLQMKTPGGTLCHDYKYTISAGVSFTVTAVNSDRSDCTTDTSTLSWWLINKQ